MPERFRGHFFTQVRLSLPEIFGDDFFTQVGLSVPEIFKSNFFTQVGPLLPEGCFLLPMWQGSSVPEILIGGIFYTQ